VLASWIGTTGTSMLLIRPFLRANAWRKARVHQVVFFIFLVSNIGGSFAPLGDPPLFLGFLHGVPFFWNFHLLPATVITTILLLMVFSTIDDAHYRREMMFARPSCPLPTSVGLDGAVNLHFIGGILIVVLLSGLWKMGELTLLGVALGKQNLVRDAAIL